MSSVSRKWNISTIISNDHKPYTYNKLSSLFAVGSVSIFFRLSIILLYEYYLSLILYTSLLIFLLRRLFSFFFNFVRRFNVLLKISQLRSKTDLSRFHVSDGIKILSLILISISFFVKRIEKLPVSVYTVIDIVYMYMYNTQTQSHLSICNRSHPVQSFYLSILQERKLYDLSFSLSLSFSMIPSTVNNARIIAASCRLLMKAG